MKIIQSILTENDCYKLNRKMIPTGLMLHSVGCSQPSAMVFIKQWNKSGVAKCVHAFLEPDGDVFQTLPWTYRGWHSGGISNNNYIGVEMCEPSTIRYNSDFGLTDLSPKETKKFVLSTYKTAVELFSYLCKEFKLNPIGKNVIISHSEGHKLGIASGHSDPEHLWNRFNLTMDQFRKDVNSAMNGSEDEIMVDKSYVALKKVTTDILNVRSAPNASAKDMGDLKLNDIITVSGIVGQWYRIPFNGTDCYIHGNYLIDYTEVDYKSECEKLKKENSLLSSKINSAINVLK